LDDNNIAINDLPNDTEAAIRYIKTLLPLNKNNTFKYPPIIFVHQLYDIIHNKTLINKELVSKLWVYTFHVFHVTNLL